MIEDIQALRQAARLTPDNENQDEKVWCIAAGNVNLIDDIAYKAIASKHSVKILFREHVILKDKRLNKKFDVIMLYGNSRKINQFKRLCNQRGGAFIQITRHYLTEEPNLMVLVAPEDMIKNLVYVLEKSKVSFAILQESQTTGFIDVDINSNVKLPNFIKSALKPLYNISDVVLSTILISVEKDEDIEKVQSIATSNRIFVIDFKDIVTED